MQHWQSTRLQVPTVLNSPKKKKKVATDTLFLKKFIMTNKGFLLAQIYVNNTKSMQEWRTSRFGQGKEDAREQ